jgi:hypothetical protein
MLSDQFIDGEFGLMVRLAPAETSDIHRTQLRRYYHGSRKTTIPFEVLCIIC